MRSNLFPLYPKCRNSGTSIPPCEKTCHVAPEACCEEKKICEPIKVLVKFERPECCRREFDPCCCRRFDPCCCERFDPCCCEQRRCCCEPRLLNSATGGAGPLPLLGVGGITLTQPIPIVSVTIDTCGICDPSVLLSFTTQINLPALTVAALGFVVTRTGLCGSATTIGSTFTYTNTAGATAVTDSFSFQLFDNNLRSGVYTYTVSLATSTTASVAGVTLVNSTLSASAGCNFR